MSLLTVMEIKLAQKGQVNEIFDLLRNCKYALDRQGIFQWVDSYPTISVVKNDIENRHLYCAFLHNKCAGVVTMNNKQDPEYAAIDWNIKQGNFLIIHRLAVDPLLHGRGVARKLMDFAEQFGTDSNYHAVRLDAYSANTRVLKFYEARGYGKRGEVFFPGRKLPFFCYEKSL